MFETHGCVGVVTRVDSNETNLQTKIRATEISFSVLTFLEFGPFPPML